MIIEGTIYWCKLDKPRDNYNKQRKIMNEAGEPDGWNREWTVTLGNLTKEAKLALRDAGLLDRVKNKMDDLEDQITFRLAETKKDGEKNDPITVKNAATGEDWDWKEDGLIGNGSRGAVKFNVWKKGAGKASMFPVSLLVLEHEPYEGGSGDYEDPDDWSNYTGATKSAPAAKAKTKAKAQEDEDLDDEIPF